MGDNLKEKTIGAFKWSAVDRFGQQIVQFIIGVILARLLSRADFGLIGMVMIFSALSFVLVESGFGQALVRKQDADERDFNTIFYTNIFIALLLYIILFFTTPLIATFFHQPQLVSIGRVMFIAIICNAMYLVPYVKLGRIMDFKTIAKVNILSTTLSGLFGVIMALTHFGVWSLVVQQVLYQFFRMVFFYLFVKWKPQLIYSFTVIRNFWNFSINLLGTYVLNVLFNNLYVLLIGRFYNLNQVGSYTQANKLSETFNFTFQSILVGSTYSMFSQIQTEDERFRRIFRELAKKVSVITFPVFFFLIAAAKPFIVILLSEKWIEAVPYFQLLCLAASFTPLYALTISALNSRGQSKTTFKIEIIKKFLILISVFSMFKFGINAMLWGYAMSSAIALSVAIFYLKQNLNHYIKHQFLDFAGTIIFGLIIALASFSLTFFIHHLIFLFILQITAAVIIYYFGVKFFYKELYNLGLNFLMKFSDKIKKSKI
jgi:O-antigen/teichoic acid export membrane protein